MDWLPSGYLDENCSAELLVASTEGQETHSSGRSPGRARHRVSRVQNISGPEVEPKCRRGALLFLRVPPEQPTGFHVCGLACLPPTQLDSVHFSGSAEFCTDAKTHKASTPVLRGGEKELPEQDGPDDSRGQRANSMIGACRMIEPKRDDSILSDVKARAMKE